MSGTRPSSGHELVTHHFPRRPTATKRLCVSGRVVPCFSAVTEPLGLPATIWTHPFPICRERRFGFHIEPDRLQESPYALVGLSPLRMLNTWMNLFQRKRFDR